MKVIIFLAIIVLGAQSLTVNEVHEKWTSFQKTFEKSYEGLREAKNRFVIFSKNIHDIEEHNKLYEQGKVTYKKGINQFADLTKDEFMAYINRYKMEIKRGSSVFTKVTDDVPDSIDWRDSGLVTDVKDQKQCGSCWAFSTTGCLEGQLKIKTGNLTSLSEQQLVDCAGDFKPNVGCTGGLMDAAYQYIIQNGIESEKDYPYKASDNKCQYDETKVVTYVSSYVDLPVADEDALKSAVATVGPISVGMDATDALQFYATGILDDKTCKQTPLNHGILVAGYGTHNDKDYWLIKNSWGKSWGEDGYFRLARNKHNQCGITTAASYPVI